MNDKQRKLAEKVGALDGLYSDRIVELIRLKYSINAELAIQRQRETKVEDFEEYNAYVEECKVKAYKEIYGENKAR
ncbi:MAG: hypothetical protein KBT03_11460 [Bacteroidales bacterium]|nr:hypothetical protein [Candidatus Scybalousia scybalohippi]